MPIYGIAVDSEADRLDRNARKVEEAFWVCVTSDRLEKFTGRHAVAAAFAAAARR